MYIANPYSPFAPFHSPILEGESPFLKGEWTFERTNSPLIRMNTITYKDEAPLKTDR
jgi:hypothetical protein